MVKMEQREFAAEVNEQEIEMWVGFEVAGVVEAHLEQVKQEAWLVVVEELGFDVAVEWSVVVEASVAAESLTAQSLHFLKAGVLL